MIDAAIRHHLHADPGDMTIHQSLIAFEEVGRMQAAKAGEETHRLNVERDARRMRLTNGDSGRT